MEENMSNLTSASGEASVSSNQQSSFAPHNPATAKKKRNLPGNPDPDAEVIALSPKTLLATNRFVCDICNKGFQRDQNLQLHRRGHNLPWKLKQRTSKEVRKKVYICPEVSCVHHDPSRALGDLTGIKKHFCRKHGEKKWKCDKCSKKYAVQSDWKAHTRTCGTREYRCDCGTLFSRRDSFITHRAFCDALAEEGARTISPANPPVANHHHQMVGFQQTAPHETSSTLPNTTVQTQFPQMMRTTEAMNSTTTSRHSLQELSLKGEHQQQQNFNLKPEILPPWIACQAPGPPTPTSLNHIDLPPSIYSPRLDSGFPPQENPSPHPPTYQFSTASPHLSATALLRKAAQMGATMSRPTNQGQMAANTTSTSGFGIGLPSHGMNTGGGFAHGSASSTAFLLDMASLTSASGLNGPFEEAFGGMLGSKREEGNGVERFSRRSHGRHEEGGGGDAMTRDFLGLRAFSHRDILNMAGPDPCMNSSSYQQPKQNEEPWQG